MQLSHNDYRIKKRNEKYDAVSGHRYSCLFFYVCTVFFSVIMTAASKGQCLISFKCYYIVTYLLNCYYIVTECPGARLKASKALEPGFKPQKLS